MDNLKEYRDSDGELINIDSRRFQDISALVNMYGFNAIALTLADIATVRASEADDVEEKQDWLNSANHCNNAANDNPVYGDQ